MVKPPRPKTIFPFYSGVLAWVVACLVGVRRCLEFFVGSHVLGVGLLKIDRWQATSHDTSYSPDRNILKPEAHCNRLIPAFGRRGYAHMGAECTTICRASRLLLDNRVVCGMLVVLRNPWLSFVNLKHLGLGETVQKLSKGAILLLLVVARLCAFLLGG